MISLLRRWIFPTPPTGHIGYEKENLQEHVWVQLDLVEQKKKKDDIYQSNRPAQDMSAGRKPNGYQSCKCAEKFYIAHAVTQYVNEDLIYVKEWLNH